ncbi:MAG: PAS domain S-box protein, partial [Desulfobacteraceae bacterium]|nr:PAS domain S-box protein [Desulfobacteraceae bacterium]
VHPEMREEIKQRILSRSRGEQVPSRYEFKGITKDGEVKWADCSAVVIEYDNEPAILTVSVDITDRKLAEEALQETEKKLEAIVNHHFQLTGMLDTQGRLIMANKTALKYLNVAESDVIGKLFWETPWWTHSKEEQDKLQKAIHIAGKGEFVRFETSHLNLNGELRIMDFSINPVIDDEGNVKYLIPEGRDITDLKNAEESLRQSESQLRTLANRLQEAEEMARKALARELHDQVGQSLTALNINLNILRNRMPLDVLKQLEERLDDSMELVEETTKTIRDVMAELRPSVLDDYGLTAALRWYGKRFSDRTGISIKLQMDEMSSRLTETVESALFRITQEALTNVAKHANASELVLTLQESDGLFRLIIADNGKGFDYTAISKSGDRKGWGILNMQERIQVLGGQLLIESEPRKGTSVIIEILK